VTHLDYQLTTNIWLPSAMVMPTAPTPKDRTTAAVRKAMQEMEINAMVTYGTSTLYLVRLVYDILITAQSTVLILVSCLE